MDSSRFYSALQVIAEFEALTRAESYAELPADWQVAFCDVRNSTAAVAAGKYRNVNSIGAAAITAVINAAQGVDIPFSFEGDGAVICVPPGLVEATRAALAKTREVARDAFDLDLRIATVPVAEIPQGFKVLVARYRVSENYVQAVFSGGGIACIDALVKDPETGARYLIAPGSVEPNGSFDGFECRWQDIPSRHGETVSLMVLALHHEAERASAVYREVIKKVREIYGDEDACHPVSVPELAVTLSGSLLADEAGIRANTQTHFGRWRWMMHARLMVLACWLGADAFRYTHHCEELESLQSGCDAQFRCAQVLRRLSPNTLRDYCAEARAGCLVAGAVQAAAAALWSACRRSRTHDLPRL